MRYRSSQNPTIAVVTHESDLHAYAVAERLRSRFGVTAHIFELDTFFQASGLTWSPQAGSAPVFPTPEGESIDLRGLDSIWMRRFGNRISSALEQAVGSAHREFVHSETVAAALGMLGTEFGGKWIDHPDDIRIGQNKLLQLKVAREVGWRIPATLVSQTPERIRAFCADAAGDTVVKVVAGMMNIASATTPVSAELLADDASLALCPAIYQECIPGRRHLRVQVFGDRVHAALFESGDLDWRFDLDIPAREYALPDTVSARLVAVLDRLNLTMGIFDLKLTDDDEYVWLEVNPQGQWLFVEGMTGMPLIDSFAEFLYRATKNR